MQRVLENTYLIASAYNDYDDQIYLLIIIWNRYRNTEDTDGETMALLGIYN